MTIDDPFLAMAVKNEMTGLAEPRPVKWEWVENLSSSTRYPIKQVGWAPTTQSRSTRSKVDQAALKGG